MERHLAADAVGIPQGTGLHACRHTYASALIRYGESVKTVQHLLGHSSAVTTLNIYARLWPDVDDRARAAVGAVFADVPSPGGRLRKVLLSALSAGRARAC